MPLPGRGGGDSQHGAEVHSPTSSPAAQPAAARPLLSASPSECRWKMMEVLKCSGLCIS